MNKTRLLAIAVPIFLILTLIFNGLASSGALNGLDTGEISARYPVLFTPANYVFSIWGLIYLALGAFSIYQILPKNIDDKSLNNVRVWFLVTSVLNSLWILLWQYEYLLLSLPIMIFLLLSLIKLYVDEEIGVKEVDSRRRWFVQAPFSLYLGWISVATIANFSVVLYDLGWNGFGITDEIWTVIMILVAAALGLLMIFRRNDYIFPLVLIWATLGISVKNSGAQLITYAVASSIVALLISVLYQLYVNKSED